MVSINELLWVITVVMSYHSFTTLFYFKPFNSISINFGSERSERKGKNWLRNWFELSMPLRQYNSFHQLFTEVNERIHSRSKWWWVIAFAIPSSLIHFTSFWNSYWMHWLIISFGSGAEREKEIESIIAFSQFHFIQRNSILFREWMELTPEWTNWIKWIETWRHAAVREINEMELNEMKWNWIYWLNCKWPRPALIINFIP